MLPSRLPPLLTRTVVRIFPWLRATSACAFLAYGAVASATPQVTITPIGHDFGIQLVDTRSAPFTGLLTNTGTSPMTLERFAVANFRQSNGGWVQAGSCQDGVVLNAGTSCTFAVTFSPGSLGAHLGSYCIVVPEAKYFDCNSTLVLSGTGVQQEPYVYLMTGFPPSFTPGSLGMGRADLGMLGPVQLLGLQNLGMQDLVVMRWEITGEHASDFLLGNQCGPGTTLPARTWCTVDVRFRPTAIGQRNAWLTVYSNGVAPYPAVRLTGSTTGPVMQTGGNFGAPRIGSRVFSRVAIGNDSSASFQVTTIRLSGADAGDVALEGCVGSVVLAGGTCTFELAYVRPDAEPQPHATFELAVDTTAGSALGGWSAFVGVPESPSVFVRVVEYYDAARDHYFIASTNQLAEVRDLDTGVHPGWAKTGKSFYAFSEYGSPVCRFYIPPAFGDSHFYSASPAECQDTTIRFPHLVYESPDVFSFLLPHLESGACPAETVPVYRLWNNRSDSNHRYTTETSVVDRMLASGWHAEGYGPGPYLPVACAPPPMQSRY